MNAFAPYIAALHQQDLLDEAELERQRAARSHKVPGRRRGPARRRGLGALFASAARSLDPSVEAESPSRQRLAPDRSRRAR